MLRSLRTWSVWAATVALFTLALVTGHGFTVLAWDGNSSLQTDRGSLILAQAITRGETAGGGTGKSGSVPVPEFKDPLSKQKVSALDAAHILTRLQRTVLRRAVSYAAAGMWNPIPYDKAYGELATYQDWFYSDSGPGGMALQSWLERQSIYSER